MSAGAGPAAGRLTPGSRTTRRALLALGVGAAGALFLRSPARAAALTVTVGGLAFEVPAYVRPTPVSAAPGGPGWSWRGDRTPLSGVFVVLARADLASTDAEEVVGWLLAGGLVGDLPALTTEGRRVRATPGGGDQARLDVAYAAGAAVRYHGTLLVATRPTGPAGVVLVLGDDQLTAGEVSGVLDSTRWVG